VGSDPGKYHEDASRVQPSAASTRRLGRQLNPLSPLEAKAKAELLKLKSAPQPGRWVDWDCNAALNMQRIGESRWRQLELCWWPEQLKLLAAGREYPGLGCVRLRDPAPIAQALQPAVAPLRASGSGQQEVVGERRQVIKSAIRSLVEAARPDLSPAQVDALVAEMNKRMTMGSKQCCLTAVLCLLLLLQSFLGQPTEGFPAADPAPGPSPPRPPPPPPVGKPRIQPK
ncbi:hypothetical protein QJQ45_030159, partial [Haematococcus lacustris]